MSLSAIWSVWCDHPDGGCRSWAGQSPLRREALATAMAEGWHQVRDEGGRFTGEHHCPDHSCKVPCHG